MDFGEADRKVDDSDRDGYPKIRSDADAETPVDRHCGGIFGVPCRVWIHGGHRRRARGGEHLRVLLQRFSQSINRFCLSTTFNLSETNIMAWRFAFVLDANNSVCPGHLYPAACQLSLQIGAVTTASRCLGLTPVSHPRLSGTRLEGAADSGPKTWAVPHWDRPMSVVIAPGSP